MSDDQATTSTPLASFMQSLSIALQEGVDEQGEENNDAERARKQHLKTRSSCIELNGSIQLDSARSHSIPPSRETSRRSRSLAVLDDYSARSSRGILLDPEDNFISPRPRELKRNNSDTKWMQFSAIKDSSPINLRNPRNKSLDDKMLSSEERVLPFKGSPSAPRSSLLAPDLLSMIKPPLQPTAPSTRTSPPSMPKRRRSSDSIAGEIVRFISDLDCTSSDEEQVGVEPATTSRISSNDHTEETDGDTSINSDLEILDEPWLLDDAATRKGVSAASDGF